MSAELRCTGTPISWLRLELHHAGELASAERDAITAHLAECGACSACSAKIESDALAPLAPLPPLPASHPARVEPVAKVSLLRRIAPPLTALAIAAGLLLFLRRGAQDPDAPDAAPVARTKGGDVGFVLVREDEARVTEAGGVYREGDRWKALVTCPTGMHAAWDLAVFEHGDAAFPIEPQSDLACGNEVLLPGAFRTTGRERMTVCLVWDDSRSVDRSAIRRTSPDALTHASCKVLEPAP